MKNAELKYGSSDTLEQELLVEKAQDLFIPFAVLGGAYAATTQNFHLLAAISLYMLVMSVMRLQAKSNKLVTISKSLDTLSNDSQSRYAVHAGSIIKQHRQDVMSPLSTLDGIKKAVGLNYNYKLIESQVLSAKESNYVTPVLFSDEMLREHTCVIATTGGGKTEMLMNAYVESQVARGGGVFAVFGKSDNNVLQTTQAIAAKYNRLQDFLVYDFTETESGKTNTNTINLFEMGNQKQTITMFVNIADINDKDSWGQSSKSYLVAALKAILVLRDGNMFVDVAAIDHIYEASDKLEEYKKNIRELDYFGFHALVSNLEKLIKLLLIFDEIYKTNNQELTTALYSAMIANIDEDNEDNVEASFSSNEDRNHFHYELKNVIAEQSAAPSWQKIKENYNGGIESLSEKFPVREGVFYKLNISIGQLSKLFGFFDSFASVLKNKYHDINLLDAVDSNKIVIVNLPGQNKVYSPVIAELLISLLNVLLERRGKSYISDTTTLCILDEINSWLKTKDNKSYDLGDILSVIRGLNMGAVLSFQSDLKKTLGEVDASQVFANVNTIIALRLTDTELLKKINEQLPKREVYTMETTVSLNSNSKNSTKSNEKRFNREEKDYLMIEQLKQIKKGEGFLIRNATAAPFMAKFIAQPKLYKTSKDPVRLIKYIDLETLKKDIHVR